MLENSASWPDDCDKRLHVDKISSSIFILHLRREVKVDDHCNDSFPFHLLKQKLLFAETWLGSLRFLYNRLIKTWKMIWKVAQFSIVLLASIHNKSSRIDFSLFLRCLDNLINDLQSRNNFYCMFWLSLVHNSISSHNPHTNPFIINRIWNESWFNLIHFMSIPCQSKSIRTTGISKNQPSRLKAGLLIFRSLLIDFVLVFARGRLFQTDGEKLKFDKWPDCKIDSISAFDWKYIFVRGRNKLELKFRSGPGCWQSLLGWSRFWCTKFSKPFKTWDP